MLLSAILTCFYSILVVSDARGLVLVIVDSIDFLRMVSLEQWRCAIGSFASFKLRTSCAVLNCKSCVSLECFICVIVYASIIGMLLIHGLNDTLYFSLSIARVNAL